MPQSGTRTLKVGVKLISDFAEWENRREVVDLPGQKSNWTGAEVPNAISPWDQDS